MMDWFRGTYSWRGRLAGLVLGRRPAWWWGWVPTMHEWNPACAPGHLFSLSFRPEYPQTNQSAHISCQDSGAAGIGISCLQRF